MYRKSKKLIVWALVVSMVLTQMIFSNVAFASTKYAGTDRYATSAAIAMEFGTADTAVLATGDDYPDALAAAPLAKAYDAPILLTGKAALNSAVKTALTDLGVSKVIIVGGEGAVSPAVATAVTDMGLTVERIAGTSRIDTALEIAKALEAKTGVAATEVFVATAFGFADALAASPIAAAQGAPILLTAKDAVSQDVVDYIGSKDVYVLGGEGAVSAAVAAKFAGAERLSGADRYATNLAILKAFDLDYSNVYVATGANYPDALAGSVLAAKASAPLVLVGASMTTAMMNYLKEMATADTVVSYFGGVSSVVSAAGSLESALTGMVPATLQVESVSAINSITLAVKFNKAVDKGTAETEANYSLVEVGGSALDLDDTTPIELQKDNQTVYLNLKTSANALPKSATDYTVHIKDVLDVNGDEITEYTKVVSLNDNVRPTVTSAGFTNNNVYEIKFSEPLQTVDNTVVKVYEGYDDVTSSVTIGTNTDQNKATITGTSSLDDTKTYTVKVLNAKDYTGNVISPNPYEKDFSVSEDTTAPKLSSVEVINKRAFTVKFNEPIDTTGTEFVVDIDDVTNAVTISAVSDTNDTEFTVDLGSGNELSEGLHKVTIKTFSDVAGNAATKAYAAYYKFADSKPVLNNTKGVIKTLAGNKYVVFAFDRDLDNDVGGFANVDSSRAYDGISYDVTLASGNFDLGVAGSVAGLEDNEIAYDITAASLSSGDYTFTLPVAFVTAYGSSNKSVDVSFSYNTSDSTVELDKATSLNMAGSVIDTTAAINGDNGTEASVNEVVLVFTNKLNDTAKNANNYRLDGVNVFKSAVFYNDKKTVKLTLNDNVVKYDGLYVLSIKSLQDENGKAVKEFNDTVKFLENQKPFIVGAKVKSLSTIEVTFNENIDLSGGDNITTDDFKVTVNGTEVDLASNDPLSATGKVATLTLADALDNLNAVVKVKTSSTFDGVDANGNKGVKESEVTAKWDVAADTTAPTAVIPSTTGATTNDADTLVVTFSEALFSGGAAIANNADIKAKFTLGGTTAGTTSITSAVYDATAHTVTFTIGAVDDADTIIANAGALTDAAGNAYTAELMTYASAGTIWSK